MELAFSAASSLLRLTESIIPLFSITMHSSAKNNRNITINHRIKNNSIIRKKMIIPTGGGISINDTNGKKNMTVENNIISVQRPAIRRKLWFAQIRKFLKSKETVIPCHR